MEKITNQSMSQILSHLLALGYIIRRSSKTDKRKVIISLTQAGESILMQIRSERDEWLSKAIERTCNAKEKAQLKNAIKLLTKIVDFE
jgi:DNA-binding MarR family transcriptional regulator